LKRSIVHPVDLDHLDDTEVKHGTTGSDRSELFALLTNFSGLFTGLDKFIIHLTGLKFNVSEHIDKFNVIK